MSDKISWGIAAVIYTAILYVLVRPNSKGPAIIKSLGAMLTDLVRGATGETFNGTSWSTGT